MLDVGLNPDLVLYNIFIHGFCSIGNMDEACNCGSKMCKFINAHSSNIMALTHNGKVLATTSSKGTLIRFF